MSDVATAAPNVSMRSFWQSLSPTGRWMLSTTAFQTLGRGMTLPFTVVYLNEVRGQSLSTAGVLMGLVAVVALVVGGPSGALTDRWGARVMLIIGNVAGMLGALTLAFAATVPVLVVAFSLLGVSFGIGWSSWNSFIASVVTGAVRQQFFGVNFALINLGIGVGGAVGGFYVDVDNPQTFTLVYLIDAVCLLIPLALLFGPLRHVHARAEAPPEGAAPARYLAVLRNPTVLWLTLLTFIMTLVGYGQMEAGFQAWSRQVSEVSTRTLGLAFTVNTIVIVGLQFMVLKRTVGRRRTRVLMVMALTWAIAWSLLAITQWVPGTLTAAALVMGFAAVFGLGETMMQSTIPSMVNDLASDHTRGRYNAVNGAAFQLGAIVGPVCAGFLLQHRWHTAFIAVVLLGCLAVAASALGIERLIPSAANGQAAD